MYGRGPPVVLLGVPRGDRLSCYAIIKIWNCCSPACRPWWRCSQNRIDKLARACFCPTLEVLPDKQPNTIWPATRPQRWTYTDRVVGNRPMTGALRRPPRPCQPTPAPSPLSFLLSTPWSAPEPNHKLCNYPKPKRPCIYTQTITPMEL